MSILVTLAIGIALSAVGQLLAPKVPTPTLKQERDRQRSRTLGSSNGRTRFNATAGFSGAAPLAEYGSRVPIIFTRWQYRAEFNEYSGGVFINPALVWSRMFSYGGYQGYKAQYVVGEHGPTPPDLAGVFIGENTLAGVWRHQFAIYWSSKEGSNRLTGSDLILGTRGDVDKGDPENNSEAFMCPTRYGEIDSGFCAAFTPSNNRTFGVYAPIRNGTHVRHNWRVISMYGDEDQKLRPKNERKKIAGGDADRSDQGMPGLGRGYCACMGLVRVNDTDYDLPTMVTLQVGDRLMFKVNDKEFESNEYDKGSGVDNNDMDDRTRALREEADDALQLGETFMIGRFLFQVNRRPEDKWRIKEGEFNYWLKCVEHLQGSNQIRLAGTNAISKSIGYNGANYEPWWCGQSNFPLLRVEIPAIRNTRPVECTEFGIPSTVWQQVNGLCNFSSVPAPERLVRFDEKEVSLTTGSQTRYVTRASAFTVFFRPAGHNDNGELYDWENLLENFVVIGRSPVEVYNYLRFEFQGAEEREFRFVPICGADLRYNYSPDDRFWRLDATMPRVTRTRSTRYGKIKVQFSGKSTALASFTSNREFSSSGGDGGAEVKVETINGISLLTYLPTDVSTGRYYNYLLKILGDPGARQGQTRSITESIAVGSRSIRIKFTATSGYRPDLPLTSGGWYWEHFAYEYVDALGKWTNGEVFDHVPPGNNYGARYQVSTSTTTIPGLPASGERWFESTSQIADISYYDEVTRSSDSGPEHEIVYVNESTIEDYGAPQYEGLAMVGLALRASKQFANIDQIGLWLQNGVNATRFSWSKTVGPANKFSDLVYHLLTNSTAGIGKTINANMIDESGFYRTGKFLANYRLYWNGVLGSEVNLRQYFGEVGPLHLCNFVVRNGRFTVEPALPTNADGQIITGPIPVAALFTAGNIIDGTFSIEFTDQGDRLPMRASMQYRYTENKNKLFEEKSIMVRWADEPSGATWRQEAIDMTEFCTTRHHAFMAARYVMSVKRRITHILKFKTTPEALNVAPGVFIRVDTQASPYSLYNNAVVQSDGTVKALQHIDDGTYNVSVYRQGSEEVEDAKVTIQDGHVNDPTLFNALFAVKQTVLNRGYYQIEEVGLDEDGLVEITASHHPTDSSGSSIIVKDVLDESRFVIES